jgi:hypothetical protein
MRGSLTIFSVYLLIKCRQAAVFVRSNVVQCEIEFHSALLESALYESVSSRVSPFIESFVRRYRGKGRRARRKAS